jgi:hypothetical protein
MSRVDVKRTERNALFSDFPYRDRHQHAFGLCQLPVLGEEGKFIGVG